MESNDRAKRSEGDERHDGDLSAEETLRAAPPGSGIINSSREGQAVSENPVNRTKTGRTGHTAQREGIDVD